MPSNHPRCGECDHLLSRHTPNCDWPKCSCEMGKVTLTAREFEALKFFAQGLGAKEVAAKMNVGLDCVETHRYNMMRKAQVKTMVHMVLSAVNAGLIKLEDLPKFEVPLFGPSE